MRALQREIKSAEDKAYEAANGANYGFKRMKCAPAWAKELMVVNEGPEKLERAINCLNCVVAHEARMRGYDVKARPIYGFSDQMRSMGSLLSVFDKPNAILRLSSEELAGDIRKSVENTIKLMGQGARAFIWFEWNANSGKRGGHIIVAEYRGKGVVNFGDPQSKSMAAFSQLKDANAESIKLMRVDDLRFTDLVRRCCMNRGD